MGACWRKKKPHGERGSIGGFEISNQAGAQRQAEGTEEILLISALTMTGLDVARNPEIRVVGWWNIRTWLIRGVPPAPSENAYVPIDDLLYALQEECLREGFFNKISSSGLHRPNRQRNVCAPGQQDYRNGLLP